MVQLRSLIGDTEGGPGALFRSIPRPRFSPQQVGGTATFRIGMDMYAVAGPTACFLFRQSALVSEALSGGLCTPEGTGATERGALPSFDL